MRARLFFIGMKSRRSSLSGSFATMKAARTAAVEGAASGYAINSGSNPRLIPVRNRHDGNVMPSGHFGDAAQHAPHIRIAMSIDAAEIGGDWINDDVLECPRSASIPFRDASNRLAD